LRISLSPRRERVRVRGIKIYDIFLILPSSPPFSSPLKGEEMRKGNPGEPGFDFLK